MSSVPAGKEELLAAVEKSFTELMKDLRNIPEGYAAEESLPGHAKGGVMSLHNLVAYLIGWNELVLKWHALRNDGKPVNFPDTGFKWNELGRLARKFYADYAALDFSALLKKLAVTKNEIIVLIEGYTDEQLYGQPWHDKWTMGRMIQFNTSSPYKNARARVRKWKKEKGL